MTFTTPIITGNDVVLVETNTKTVDGPPPSRWPRIVSVTVVVQPSSERSASTVPPLVRVSTIETPSFEGNGVYIGGGASGANRIDSTIYNAIEGEYGVLVATAGARTQFLSPNLGFGDTLRIDAQDSRSGLRRAIGTTIRFGQNGLTGANTTLGNSYNRTGCFLPATIDGWLPVPPLHVPGAPPRRDRWLLLMTTEYVVDNAGNVSGCPFAGTVSGSFCTASVASATANTNPAMVTVALQNANLFARRTLALDPVQPGITARSPNNSRQVTCRQPRRSGRRMTSK